VKSVEANDTILLNVHNPGQAGNFTLSVKVPSLNFQAYSEGSEISTDIFCHSDDILNNCDLYFSVKLEAMNQKLVLL
jgi:hypothetical protein